MTIEEEAMEDMLEMVEWERWDDPGDYPNGIAFCPLPSQVFALYRDDGDTFNVLCEAGEAAKIGTEFEQSAKGMAARFRIIAVFEEDDDVCMATLRVEKSWEVQ